MFGKKMGAGLKPGQQFDMSFWFLLLASMTRKECSQQHFLNVRLFSKVQIWCPSPLGTGENSNWIILLILLLLGIVTWHSYIGWFCPVLVGIGLRQKCLFSLVWKVSKWAFIFKKRVHFQNAGSFSKCAFIFKMWFHFQNVL